MYAAVLWSVGLTGGRLELYCIVLELWCTGAVVYCSVTGAAELELPCCVVASSWRTPLQGGCRRRGRVGRILVRVLGRTEGVLVEGVLGVLVEGVLGVLVEG